MVFRIDCHAHVGCYKDTKWTNGRWGELTPDALFAYMDRLGIDAAVLLPAYSWDLDKIGIRTTTESALDLCREYPDKLIPFCVLEVREGEFKDKLKRYRDEGCVGYGEHTSKIQIDHPLNLRLFRLCGKLELPVLMHMAVSEDDDYGILDTLNLDGLEKILKIYSDVNFILHGQGWWRFISATFDPQEQYPKGKIQKSGRAVQLLEEYENLYGDLSAYSGYNALSRDIEFGKKFLKMFSKKLIFGTDMLAFFEPEKSHIDLLERFDLSMQEYENICHRNLEKIIGIKLT